MDGRDIQVTKPEGSVPPNAQRGDKVTTLDDRLANLDKEIGWLKRLVYAVLLISLIQAIAPDLDLLAVLLQLIGL